MNLGYMELGGGGLSIKIYYDVAWLANDPNADPAAAPLVNGPRGYCLDMTNTTGKNVKLVVNGVGSSPLTISVGQGDPVTTGPASGRSRTAAQMSSFGFTTRGNVGAVEIDPD